MWNVVGGKRRDNLDMNFVQTGRLSVAQPLHAFIEHEALPGTGISAATLALRGR